METYPYAPIIYLYISLYWCGTGLNFKNSDIMATDG